MRASLYTRPAGKPLTVVVRNRTAPADQEPIKHTSPLIVDRATECHVTPTDVCETMVYYLGPQGDYLTLEPSAGTGAIIATLLAAGHNPVELVAIERHNALASALNVPHATILNRCFLDYAAEQKGKIKFPRIIMNPPFSQVRHHMKAALSLLGGGGHDEPAVLVALVPITYQHDDMETLEILPDTTFSTAKVNTKIVRFTI